MPNSLHLASSSNKLSANKPTVSTPISSKHTPLPCLFGLSLLALPTQAFDSTGGIASLFVIVGLGGFCLINALLQGFFFFAGKYRSANFAKRHVIASLIVPLIAFTLAIYDYRAWGDFAFNLGSIMVAVGLQLLPLQFKQINKAEAPYASYVLWLGGLLILTLSYIIPPLAFFAVILAHVALTSQPCQTAGFKLTKVLIYLTLAASYALFGYWLYQTLMTGQAA